MTNPKEKNSLEKFFDTLGNDEKLLFSSYVQKKTYESLSDKLDELLKKPHEVKKANSQRV